MISGNQNHIIYTLITKISFKKYLVQFIIFFERDEIVFAGVVTFNFRHAIKKWSIAIILGHK